MNENIALRLTGKAEEFKKRKAVYKPETITATGRTAYTSLTYSQLENMSCLYADFFKAAGIRKGTETFMLLRPGLEFTAAVFGIFKLGAVPILIDPGMGRANLLNCVKNTAPEAMIAVSAAHWVKKIFPSKFKSVRISISMGKFAPPGVLRLENALSGKSLDKSFHFETVHTDGSDPAAILFTTGSTGPPKGVVYTHEMFNAQIDIITETYGSGAHETDMSAFALFALFATSMGMPTVIPDMDFTRPAEVKPEKIITAVNDHDVTFSFGSPALWRKTAAYCVKNSIKMPSLRKVLMAGAPVPEKLHRAVLEIISPEGETMIPYGATEALPVTNFNGREMIAETSAKTSAGAGYCVGRPLKGVTVKIIKPVDSPIEKWEFTFELDQGEKGEIVVKGPIVSPRYNKQPDADKISKIKDSDGKIWHRMGDIGFFDTKGRLWFCGRKSHCVKTPERIYYPVCCEAVFNRDPSVFRTALVGVENSGRQKPVLIIEPRSGKMPRGPNEERVFIERLSALGKEREFTASIDTFLFHRKFPVDIRHNAKIFREKLSVWAGEKLSK